MKQLLALVACSALALFLVACGTAMVLAVSEVLSPSELWDVAGALWAGFWITLALGAIPALLLGAPIYWLFWRSGRGGWSVAAGLGVVLGCLVGLIEPALLPWGVACGLVTALLARLASRWVLR